MLQKNINVNKENIWKTQKDCITCENFKYFKNFAPKVSVVTEGKWKSVRLFEQWHCAICGGMLLGVMCEVRTFIVEFVMKWGVQCVKLGMVIYRGCGTYGY